MGRLFNRLQSLRLALAVAAAAFGASGCAYFSPKMAPEQPQAGQIAVYEAFPPTMREYRLVKRLWVEPWSSAIAVPLYPSVGAGAADLRSHAVALGGDAIMNFACSHTRVDPRSDYYCNGTVIKFVQ